MHILGLIAENYKKIRVVEINPQGKLIQITGKNGAGKTSVLDSIWAALVGAKAIPERPVRKGADRARIKLNLGEFTVTRVIMPDGGHQLTVENANGVRVATPQKILDDLLGSLSFDPMEFIEMKPKEQIETLRAVAKIKFDNDAMSAQNKADFENRTIANREITRVQNQLAGITWQDGLPKNKIDEAEILRRISDVDRINQEAHKTDDAKKVLEAQVALTKTQIDRSVDAISELLHRIDSLKRELKAAEETKKALDQRIKKETEAVKKMPDAVFVEVGTLTAELQQAQVTNREIDKAEKYKTLETELRSHRKTADRLTRQIEEREEQKRQAMEDAKMPVEGLAFDDNQVLYKGIPLEQLGTAEQIRISTAIAMAGNPKLKVIRIMHGEALDEDSLALLAAVAEENDYQIWMARVDTTGKCGIIMQDGMIKAND
jgi:DNA repair exonuclease SbcCD ATPase subunit